MDELTSLEKDTISEVGNISLGAAATALSAILDRGVDITTPRLEEIGGEEVQLKYPTPYLLVEVHYTEGLQGSNILLIKESDALAIAALMMGEPVDSKAPPLGEIELSAVQEAMNQMMGSMATAMSELFQRPIEISPPTVALINRESDLPPAEIVDSSGQYLHVEFSVLVEGVIESVMAQVIPVPFARNMATYLLAMEEQGVAGSEAEAASSPPVHGQPGAGSEATGPGAVGMEQNETGLSALERDTIGEVGNISLGSSATALSTLLDRGVEITTPLVDVIKAGQLREKYPIPCLLVEVEYTSGLKGSNILLIKEKDALVIAALMMGEPVDSKVSPLGEIELSAVQEAMNQMMGSMATAMSELFQRPIDISPPVMELIDLADGRTIFDSFNLDPDQEVVQVEFSIKVEDIIDSVMIQVVPLTFAREMAAYLLYGQGAEPGGAAAEAPGGPEAGVGQETQSRPAISPEIVFEEVGGPGFTPPSRQTEPPPPSPAVKTAGPSPAELEKLNLVRDIPMDITVILASAKIPLGTLFGLDRGGIIALENAPGEPVEIVANDRILARGEVVMINERLGVRITEILFNGELGS